MAEAALKGCKTPSAHSELPDPRGTGPTGKRRATARSSLERSRGWREALILTPLVLLLPRSLLPLEIAPAGVAFFIALAMNGIERLPWYTLAALSSLLCSNHPYLAIAVLPAHLLILLLGGRWYGKANRLVAAAALATFASHSLVRFLVAGSSDLPWIRLLGEAGAIAFLSFVFIRAVPVLKRGAPAAHGTEEDLFLTLLPLTLATVALSPMRPFGLNLAASATSFLVVLIGYLGGPGLGASMGLVFSLVPGWSSFASWPSALGWALGGLMAGLLRRHGRLAAVGGFSLGFALALVLGNLPNGPSFPPFALAGESLAGVGAFLALPMRSVGGIGLAPPEEESWSAVKRKEQARLRALLSERVHELAGIFAELSKAFSTNEPGPSSEPDLYTLLEEVVRRNCQACSGFDACWRQNFYRTYRELFDLIALAEMNGEAKAEDLRGRLATACFQPHRLVCTVEAVLSQLRADQEARRRVIEGRGFVADQLEGVAEIMTGLAKEMHRDLDFRLEVEDRLKSSFNRFGLSVESISVLGYGQDMLEVRVKKHACLNYFECQYLVAPMVSRLLGCTFTLWEKECPRGGGHGCSFTLVPAGRYRVKHAVARLAKDPEHPGDSYGMFKTKDGRFALILSDGMGTGPKAARESQATVALLTQLLSSGFKEEFTLNLINSVLMLRTPEERFATVDLAMIDLFRGEVEMLKIGAAPSYIKRNREILAFKAATPPAGILEELAIERQRHPLSAGDYLILATDGIFAGDLGPAETEDWVERALARVEVSGPQPMADFLLRLAQANMGKEPKDDVTIIAAQILPAGP